ncbi:hypothetical protein RHGRI_028104 [Rhododendron griersonianum]|uniref:Uncharacterized protein n=1 Tax=Rhododendron griersonianum TaxID=479676 RepID=A0AAV6IGK8_9ERIC|nr:hypothetical protein RHGRI_028104 [Rhododendron griersonianum]
MRIVMKFGVLAQNTRMKVKLLMHAIHYGPAKDRNMEEHQENGQEAEMLQDDTRKRVSSGSEALSFCVEDVGQKSNTLNSDRLMNVKSVRSLGDSGKSNGSVKSELIQRLEHKIKMLEGKLREAAAIEIMEQCVARLYVAMFNAILNESDDEIPTDPVSDPISEAKVLPIPVAKASFGGGAQLKTVVCPTFGAPLIKRLLNNFAPDDFCPDPIPEAVLEALDIEDPLEVEEGFVTDIPCLASPM